uniref:Tetraspanin n=1 Tax=Plectus sambesii TaxID=2011161 RepID=A0A914W220_9BILA
MPTVLDILRRFCLPPPSAVFYSLIATKLVCCVLAAIMLIHRCYCQTSSDRSTISSKCQMVSFAICIVLLLIAGAAGVAEHIIRSEGSVFFNPAIARAAAALNNRNMYDTIVKFQTDLNCCGFMHNGKPKIYVACNTNDTFVNCSEALIAAFYPMVPSMLLAAANILIAIVLIIFELPSQLRELSCCNKLSDSEQNSNNSDISEHDVMLVNRQANSSS